MSGVNFDPLDRQFQAFYPLPQRPPVTSRYQNNNILMLPDTQKIAVIGFAINADRIAELQAGRDPRF